MAKRSAVSRGPRVAAENDIYTGLLFTAFLFLLAATIFVAYKMVSLYGTVLPPGGS